MLKKQLVKTLNIMYREFSDMRTICQNALIYCNHEDFERGYLEFCPVGSRMDIAKGTWLGEKDDKNVYLIIEEDK